MLIGAPLSASAAGLLDLYQTEDGSNNDADNSNTNTNTDTGTGSKTGPIEDKEFNLQIILDQTNVRLLGSKTTRLMAKLKWEDAVPENWNEDAERELLGKLQWESSNLKVVTARGLKGRNLGSAILTGEEDGEATVTVSLKDDTWKVDCKAETKVTVYRYATKLLFNNEKIKEDAFTGNSLVLDEYVKRYVGEDEVDTADTLTYTLIDDGGKKATLKNGILKLNKETASGKPVKVAASGKNVSTTDNGSENGSVGIVIILPGTNATKLSFSGDDVKGSKLTWLVNDKGLEAKVKASVDGKKGNKDKNCTDKITWTSANDEIVTVETVKGEREVGSGCAVKFDQDKCDITLKAHKAGNTQIIGKVSSGKTFKLNVAVSAELTGVTLSSSDATFYTGQVVNLNEMVEQQRFAKDANDVSVTSDNFTAEGLIKWEFTDKKKMSKVAKLNAKTGVLEILQDCSKGPDDWTIAVQAVNAKKSKGNKHPFTFKETDGKKDNVTNLQLAQVEIDSITVKKVSDDESNWNLSIKSGDKQTSGKKTDTINVGEVAEYQLAATGKVTTKGEEEKPLSQEEAVNALAWTASGNGKTIKAWKEGGSGYLEAVKKGSATITVSGVTKKGRKYVPIKATFKDTVNAPSQSIKLSVKNSYIPAAYKKGARTDLKINNIKLTLDKGTTTKNKLNGADIIEWTATLYDKKGEEKENANVTLNLGKVTIPAGDYEEGYTIVVNATVKNTGASDSITMTIVYPTKKVVLKKFDVDGKLTDVAKKEVVTDKNLDVCAYIESSVANGNGVADGAERAEMASYTVSGKGAVYVKAGDNGKLTIHPLRTGAVTVKFVMTDGKAATLKAEVTDVPEYIENATAAMLNISTIFENIVIE
ncbi:MAG: hypothetical protein K2K90_05915 [Lachnospiraceae bacterium]|nr:hypothetical protein [Lachnospiraceae bacterium]